MAAYRVLVSHRDLRLKSVVHLEPNEQVRYLVEAGYLKLIEEVTYVAGTEGTVDESGSSAPERSGVDSADSAGDVSRRPRRKSVKAEVTDEPDRAVSDGGPADGEEQGS